MRITLSLSVSVNLLSLIRALLIKALASLQILVPAEIEIDLFEGKPWVSLVAFTMEKIRPRYLPYFPPISNFDEINIRTYVKSKNKIVN